MDNELLLIYNHINNKSKDNMWNQRDEIEVLLSKIIYDADYDASLSSHIAEVTGIEITKYEGRNYKDIFESIINK